MSLEIEMSTIFSVADLVVDQFNVTTSILNGRSGMHNWLVVSHCTVHNNWIVMVVSVDDRCAWQLQSLPFAAL